MTFFVAVNPTSATIDALNEATVVWTYRAARGECSWVCADCCASFPSGMPDACAYDDARCTDIIKRDKIEAHKDTK